MKRERLWLGLAVAVAVAAAGACADPDSGPTASQIVVPPTFATPTTVAPTTTSTTTRPPPPGAITLAFAGDVAFVGGARRVLDRDPTVVLAPIAGTLAGADLAVVNLETAVTERGTPVPDKAVTFRAPATVFDALRAGGVDVASMANNHGVDYGDVGLADSLDAARRAAFPVIGIGRNAAEAYAPFTTVVRGQRVGVIAATQVIDDELIEDWTATDSHPGLASAKNVNRLVAAVTAARPTVETLVVFLHWGVELDLCPTKDQRGLAQRLVAAGADVVVGGHAHRQQGAGRLGDGFIAYGLGNFVFHSQSVAGSTSGVLVLTMSGRHTDRYAWVPARIRGGQPIPLEGPEATAAVDAWRQLRDCTDLAA